MSNTKTKVELAIHVLRSMAVIDASETPADTDDDVVWIVDQYEDKYAELASPGLELAYWSRDAIPTAIFGTVVDLIVNDVGGGYGRPQDPAQQIQTEEFILMKLRRHVAVEPSGLPIAADYF